MYAFIHYTHAYIHAFEGISMIFVTLVKNRLLLILLKIDTLITLENMQYFIDENFSYDIDIR